MKVRLALLKIFALLKEYTKNEAKRWHWVIEKELALEL